jgi:phosphoglycolate phosphatase-like HAD superfamily hydrolase
LILYKSTDVWRENADAIKFVNSLASTNHLLTMITGELSIGAEYKLKKLGIWKHFPTGGFGEDGLKRFDIADAALKKANELYGNDFDEMYVIGDTLLDIQTARHLGAKVISIATGSNTKEELAELKPDYLIEKFEEIKHLFL